MAVADEWKNFLSRIDRDENAHDSELFDNPTDILELRFWASYRGQTLARTGKYYPLAISFAVLQFLSMFCLPNQAHIF